MKELNRHTLKEAIRNLPGHSPKPFVWDALCMTLDKEASEKQFQSAVSGLPQYQAPDNIWDQISAELEAEPQIDVLPATKKGRIFSLHRYAAAAVILLAVVAGFYSSNLLSTKSKDGVTISYSTEKAHQVLFVADWEQDEDAFEQILTYCQDRQFACSQPEFKVLREELMDLNDARESLKIAIDRYGEDSDLIMRLAEIENERSDVLKQIIAKI
ncbi:MAG: hypothetical protein AAF990_15060 [Bacteroidota bacterium]